MPRPTSDDPAEQVRDDLARWLDGAGGADEGERLRVRTSGSTGPAKQVVLTRAAVLASAEATHRRLGGPGVWLLALPAAYVAGLQVLVRSLHAGHAPVLLGAQESWTEAVRRLEGPRRYVSLVPTQLHRVLGPEGSDADRDALAGLDAVLLGGGPVDRVLRDRAHAHGLTTVATYGMAETAGGCVYDGVPLDGAEVRLGERSRVELRGPMLMEGYDDPAATAEALVDGWFRTADAGRLHGGRLDVLGRLDDVVVSGGVNVPGGLVARRLREHPDVEAAEALGVDDPEWGRRLVAVVVGRLTLAEARAWVADVHPRAWAPRSLHHVDVLPQLPNGKTDRRALLALLGPPDRAGEGP